MRHDQFSLRRLMVLNSVIGVVVSVPLSWIGGVTGLLYALAVFAMLAMI